MSKNEGQSAFEFCAIVRSFGCNSASVYVYGNKRGIDWKITKLEAIRMEQLGSLAWNQEDITADISQAPAVLKSSS